MSQRQILALPLETGELACRHARSFARPARSPRSSTPARQGRADEELRKLLRTPLLIVDEVGYIPFDP
jgi:hypothetical protein